MNLLAKIKNCGIFLMGLAVFYSCEEKGTFGVGSDDVTPVEFSSTEVGVSSSVVLLDSIRTSNVGRILVGNVEHPDFGAIEATGYTALSARTAVQPEIPDEAQLDSVRIYFRVGYAYDTTSSNRDLGIEIYDIAESFPDTTYISSNFLSQGARLIADGNFQIEKFDSSYSMAADMAWASEFFEGVRNDDSNFTDQSNFREFFPGLVFKSKANQGNVFSIVPGEVFEVIFFYQQPNSDNTGMVNLNFKMDAEAMPYFFNLDAELSTTEFSQVQDVNTQYDNTNQLGLLTALGLVPKIDLSELVTFSNDNPNVIVNQALLELGPINDLPDGTQPPSFLFLFYTDERNTRIPNGEAFRGVQVDGANQLGSVNPVQLFYNSEDRMYRGSITSYVQTYYQDNFRRDQILLYPAEMNFTLKSFILPKDKVAFKIFYSEVN